MTTDPFTDEMVERAAHCLAMQQMPTTYSTDPTSTADMFYDDAREVLHAALTEPPTDDFTTAARRDKEDRP